MNRIGFVLFVAGLIVNSWGIALIGFLIYEFSRPIPLLAFLST